MRKSKRAAGWRLALLCSFAFTGSVAAETCKGTVFYVGTQGSGKGQGIYAARLDEDRGTLCLIGLAAELERPTWVEPHPSKPILYAASDDKTTPETRGVIAALRPEGDSGRLAAFATADSGGAGATHLALSPKGDVIFAANFRSGTVGMLSVETDGRLGAMASAQNSGTGPKPRQNAPHAHGVVVDSVAKRIFVPDLGADKIFAYQYDRAAQSLVPAAEPSMTLPPGTGPRHAALHPNGRYLYLLSEFSPVIWVYEQDSATGSRVLRQSLATGTDDEADTVKGAEIMVSADGRFLYTSTRGEDMIGVYAIKPDGTLTEKQRVSSGGKLPWSFRLDPGGNWLLVANQGDNTVTLFRRDGHDGTLVPSGAPLAGIAQPTSVAFLPR